MRRVRVARGRRQRAPGRDGTAHPATLEADDMGDPVLVDALLLALLATRYYAPMVDVLWWTRR